jgi:hypothetical protein
MRIGRWLAGIAGEDVRRLREALAYMHAAGLPSLDLAGQVVRSPADAWVRTGLPCWWRSPTSGRYDDTVGG